MRAPELTTERRTLPLGWAAAGLILGTDAALAAIPAWDHMRAIRSVCGEIGAPHCVWCVATLGLAALAAAALLQAACLALGPARPKVTPSSY